MWKAGERLFSYGSFFAFALLLGNSCAQTGTWEYCFGSLVNFVKTAIAFLGYFFLFRLCLGEAYQWLQGHPFVTKSGEEGKEKRFFKRHCFRNSFCVILASWAPFLILAWPGNLCWDVIGQIEQVNLNTGCTTLHPRYAFPIMFTMPFLYGFWLTARRDNGFAGEDAHG